MNADRNLLFGILALQMDFISRDQLVRAMNDWVLEKSKPLGEVLVGNGAMARTIRDQLEPMVDLHVRTHGGDPEKSLASISSVQSIRDDLEKIGSPDVTTSLQHLKRPTNDEDPERTETYALGKSTSEGTRFTVLRPHAKGGLGQVSVALDEELKREVALKEIQDQHADRTENRSRFTLEAEITGNLEHPGIVPVYGLGQHSDGRPFYAMRFMRGDSLKDAIDKYHKHGESDALELRKLLGRFVDVCNAMQYAHSRGVLHRDLKPGNIMLGKYGETLVVDWGLAKAMGKSDEQTEEVTLLPSSASGSMPTQMGSAIGTPAYMSPEQAAGRLDDLGPASDVYSLGATLYTLLTGKPTFSGGDLGSILQKVQEGEFEHPLEVNSSVPKALAAICLRAMAAKLHDRYASPQELADEVERFLADEPVAAYAEPITVRARRWTRRHPKSVAALAATVLVGLTSMIVVASVVTHSNRQLAQANTDLRLSKSRESQEHEKRLRSERREQARLEAELKRAQLEAIRVEAAAIIADITAKKAGPSVADYLVLQKLAESRPEVRLSVIEQLLNPAHKAAESNANRLKSRLPHIVHAVIGLDTRMRDRVRQIVEKYGNPPTDAPELNIACAKVGLELGLDDPVVTKLVRLNLLNALAEFGDLQEVRVMLLSVAARIPEKQAPDFSQHIIATMQQTPDYRELALFGHALAGLDDNLTAEFAEAGAKQIVVAMEQAQNRPSEVAALGTALGSFGDKLSPQDATAGIVQIISSMKFAKTGSLISDLARALGRVAGRLPAEPAASGAREIVAAMERITKLQGLPPGIVTRELSALAYALGSLGDKLPADQAAIGAQLIVSQLEDSREPFEVSSLTAAISGWVERFPPEQFDAVINHIVDRCGKTTEQLTVFNLARSLVWLADRVPAHQVTIVCQIMVNEIERAPSSSGRHGYGANSLKYLGSRLPPQQAAAGAKVIVAAIIRSKNYFFSVELGHALIGFVDQLPPDEAAALAVEVVSVMKETEYQRAVYYIGCALDSLGKHVDPEQAATIARKIASLMRTVSAHGDYHNLSRLGHRLGALGENVPAEQATFGAKVIVNAMEKTKTPSHLSSLVRALGRLIGTPVPEQATAAANRILAVMRETSVGYDLLSLGSALGSLSEGLAPQQAAEGAFGIATAIDVEAFHVSESDKTSFGLLVQRMETKDIIALLKSMGSRENVRNVLLAELDERSDGRIKGDMWKTVEWAIQQGIDVGNVQRMRVPSEDARELVKRKQEKSRALNEASWQVVRQPGDTPAQYDRALLQAQRACELQPDNGSYLNTLGVAQYRTARYGQALDTLGRSRSLNTKDGRDLPADIAFLAMTEHRLGNHAVANGLLDQLRQLVQDHLDGNDADSQGFLDEVVELIERGKIVPAEQNAPHSQPHSQVK